MGSSEEPLLGHRFLFACMDVAPLIARKEDRFRELEAEIASSALFDHPRKARAVMQEHARTRELLELWTLAEKKRADLEGNRDLLRGGDEEMATLAREEIPTLEAEIAKMDRELLLLLLPPDENENRDAIMEIRAGAGGNEAALFAADLYRMYCRFADSCGLRTEQLEASAAELGGFREVIFKVSGQGVFRRLRFESGVHRVQRVPATEAQGRIHTSTATVAVLPEAEEVDLELKSEDIRVEVCRAGGPGGQGVNTTDSAVQVMHIPTGMIVRCQDGRSQQKNKEKALNILRSRLLEIKQREEAEKYAAERKSQVGTGERNERIRTYNFPQNRITDHRIELTLYNLDRFIEGDLMEVISALQAAELERKLEAARAAVLQPY